MTIKVVCGILIQNNQVMIAKRNYGSSKGYYEFPGGKVEKDEDLVEAIQREWKEECDIEIENIRLFDKNVDFQDGNELVLTYFVFTSRQQPKLSVHSHFIFTQPNHIYRYHFFEADKKVVQKLSEEWKCLIKQMK